LDAETEIRNATDFCDTNPFGCSEVPVTDEFMIDGCKVYVSYILVTCPSGTSFKNMTYSFENSTACNTLKNRWNQYYPTGQYQLANEALNAFFKQLSVLIEDKYLNSLSSATSAVTLHFVETFCHSICITSKKDEEGNPISFDINQIRCGKSCCVRVTTAVRVNGRWEKTTVIVTEGSCDPLPINCEGLHISSICSPACARL
jgi:hypothetical protein